MGKAVSEMVQEYVAAMEKVRGILHLTTLTPPIRHILTILVGRLTMLDHVCRIELLACPLHVHFMFAN